MFNLLNIKIKTFVIIAIIASVISMGATIVYQNNKIKKMDENISVLKTNEESYINMLNNSYERNNVLTYDLNSVKNSKDSLIQKVNELSKSLKRKDDKLKQITAIETVYHDTIEIILPYDSSYNKICDFTIEEVLDDENKYLVSRLNEKLTIIPTVTNFTTLYIDQDRKYRNYRKNWFDRFFHWDWKKDTYYKYEIYFSNKKIQNKGVRIININEK